MNGAWRNWENQKLHEEILKSKLRELESTRKTIDVVRGEGAVQTHNVAATLDKLGGIEQNLHEWLKRADRSGQNSIQRFKTEALHGSTEKNTLEEIMKELARVKTDLVVSIQIAHVALTKKVSDSLFINSEDVRRLSSTLEDVRGSSNSLKLATLVRRCEVQGEIPASESLTSD
jgi:hypothetical protein